MRYLQCILVITAFLALTACGGGSSSTPIGTGVISLNGGNGGTGAGGNGGTITTLKNFSTATLKNFNSAAMGNFSSAVHGDLRFHAGGTVDASFIVPIIQGNFGSYPKTINPGAPTQVVFRNQTSALPAPNQYFVTDSDFNLHFVDNSSGTPTDKVVTGLTVAAGATLQLPNNNGHTVFPEAVIIDGTVTNTPDQDGGNLDLRSDSFFAVDVGGKVTTTPTGAGTDSGQLKLFSGGSLVNQGTVESNGRKDVGGKSNGIQLVAAGFIYNIGNVTAMGSSGSGTGGSGGLIKIQSTNASFYTSGTIDASGGDGPTGGGNGGSIAIIGGSAGVGRTVAEGFLNCKGGNATNSGNGGNASTALADFDNAAITYKGIIFNSFSGGIVINALISSNGGIGKGGNGGDGGSIQLINSVGSDIDTQHQVSPEEIKVTGNISLIGGQGDIKGGNGGTMAVASDTAGSSLPGFNSAEFFGFIQINLNGGGSASSNGGAGGTMSAVLGSMQSIVGVDIPAGGVYNEVPITARGGDNAVKSAGSTGGQGGSVTFMTPQSPGSSDPLRTLVNNSGIQIDVSGGAGDSGGGAGSVVMSSYGNVTNSGTLITKGGAGGTQGGAGNLVKLSSASNVVNTGVVDASGGNGTNGGNAGIVSMLSVNLTTNALPANAAVSANGGAGTSSGKGGDGGTINLLSKYFFPNNTSVLNVIKGNGGIPGKTGTIFVGLSDVSPAI